MKNEELRTEELVESEIEVGEMLESIKKEKDDMYEITRENFFRKAEESCKRLEELDELIKERIVQRKIEIKEAAERRQKEREEMEEKRDNEPAIFMKKLAKGTVGVIANVAITLIVIRVIDK